MLKTVSLDFNLLSLKKEVIGRAGEVISYHIINLTHHDPVKIYNWALAFHDNINIEMSIDDLNELYEIIKSLPTLPLIAKAQILMYLDSVKAL